MTGIKLSICIPTYNFGKFLTACLDSVFKQMTDEVEVIIVDGGSTDNTTEIIQGFQKDFAGIHYFRLEKKGGIDKDLALTVEKAHGDYCWLLSSDDLLDSGAISRMLNEIKRGHSVYLCNRLECAVDLAPLRVRPWLSDEIEDRVFNLSNRSESIEYFDQAQSLGALFSYMSSIIFKREKWVNLDYNDSLTGCNYAHVFRLFTILREGGLLKYIRDPLVICRTGNDSFLDRGLGHRFLIDLNGYHLLAEELFSHELNLKKHFMKVMQREHEWYGLVRLKSEVTDSEQWKDLENKFLIFGYSKWRLRAVRCLGSFKIVILFIPFIKKTINFKRKLGWIKSQSR